MVVSLYEDSIEALRAGVFLSGASFHV